MFYVNLIVTNTRKQSAENNQSTSQLDRRTKMYENFTCCSILNRRNYIMSAAVGFISVEHDKITEVHVVFFVQIADSIRQEGVFAIVAS